MRIQDRPEFSSKPKPLTVTPDALVAGAVKEMSAKNFGSAIVVDGEDKVLGVITERDVMKRLVNEGKDATATAVQDIMTANPRMAKADDNILDWLTIMSNERFRRLPIVDDENRILAVMTQGDFVSYTWPDLAYQAKELAKATISSNRQIFIIVAGILIYTLLLIITLRAVF